MGGILKIGNGQIASCRVSQAIDLESENFFFCNAIILRGKSRVKNEDEVMFIHYFPDYRSTRFLSDNPLEVGIADDRSVKRVERFLQEHDDIAGVRIHGETTIHESGTPLGGPLGHGIDDYLRTHGVALQVKDITGSLAPKRPKRLSGFDIEYSPAKDRLILRNAHHQITNDPTKLLVEENLLGRASFQEQVATSAERSAVVTPG